jgi:purine nucleosidase
MRLVIDTDPGVDDAHAIMAALAYPGASVDALTTVAGNVSLADTTRNACRILDAMGADTPVYAGCIRPLIAPLSNASAFHGQDGLGDSESGPVRHLPEGEHGVHALVRLANEAPAERTLVATGPLTNVAMAARLDPDLPAKFPRLVVMGGAVRGMGNATPATEYNFRGDPEAAAIVFDAWKLVTLVSWETTMAHVFTPQQVDVLLAIDTPRADFFRRITAKTLAFMERFSGERRIFEADLLATAVALEPSIVRAAETHYVQIELAGDNTRGQSSVDWFDRALRQQGGRPNCELVLEVDTDRVFEMLRAALA